jgi:hypothetical protein
MIDCLVLGLKLVTDCMDDGIKFFGCVELGADSVKGRIGGGRWAKLAGGSIARYLRVVAETTAE